MNINLSVEQRQVMSQKQALSVSILQLGQSELCEFLAKEKLENPAIDPDSFVVPYETATYQPTYFYKKSSSSDTDFDALEELNGEEDTQSLADHIFHQIKLSTLTQNEKMCAAVVCGFIEKSGYLSTPVDAICQQSLLSPTEVLCAIQFIQTLDPLGVGAENLSHCLCLQLDPQDTLGRAIATDFLSQVADGKLSLIAAALKTTVEEVTAAVLRIKALSPKPGLIYGRQLAPAFVVPDIILSVEGSKAYITLANADSSTVHITAGYSRLLKDCTDEKTTEYLTEKLEKAKWIKQCIENRSKTLLAVGNAIIAHQQDFFTLPNGQLHPLKLEDIAGEISMHSSTVSRAVKDKYLQCSRGIFPLKQLFSGGSVSTNGESVSAHTVKEQIKSLIALEDRAKPLSDQAISDILKENHIVCSRRTVAKYRESMGIASTNRR
ncbi:MAG: RNA polymerase factor sigma-54 [Oscillospiraceae bacterium]